MATTDLAHHDQAMLTTLMQRMADLEARVADLEDEQLDSTETLSWPEAILSLGLLAFAVFLVLIL